MARKVPHSIDQYVGNRVRTRRLALGMSQTKLADAIGLTFQQVQKYEKGTNRMGSSRLMQIAHVLEVPVTFFFEGAPGQPKISRTAPSPDFVTQFLSKEDGLALTRAFMRLRDAKVRRSIVHLVENIANGL
jgi:transcriptional regulator with XRE-family HTH domain